jgi:hypothetical protein
MQHVPTTFLKREEKHHVSAKLNFSYKHSKISHTLTCPGICLSIYLYWCVIVTHAISIISGGDCYLGVYHYVGSSCRCKRLLAVGRLIGAVSETQTARCSWTAKLSSPILTEEATASCPQYAYDNARNSHKSTKQHVSNQGRPWGGVGWAAAQGPKNRGPHLKSISNHQAVNEQNGNPYRHEQNLAQSAQYNINSSIWFLADTYATTHMIGTLHSTFVSCLVLIISSLFPLSSINNFFFMPS